MADDVRLSGILVDLLPRQLVPCGGQVISGIFTDFEWAYCVCFWSVALTWCIMLAIIFALHFVPRRVWDKLRDRFTAAPWWLKLVISLSSSNWCSSSLVPTSSPSSTPSSRGDVFQLFNCELFAILQIIQNCCTFAAGFEVISLKMNMNRLLNLRQGFRRTLYHGFLSGSNYKRLVQG